MKLQCSFITIIKMHNLDKLNSEIHKNEATLIERKL